MSRIFLTGDTHIPIDIKKLNSKNFLEGKKLTKDDYVIVLGDFGLIWNYIQSDKTELYWTKWLNEKPWTTLFVDGNHCCHPRLYQLPIEPKFGGLVGKVSDSIYHLKRGEIYTINGRKFFVMGGAESVDKLHRTEHINWWKEEIPSFKEMEYGLSNLEKYSNSVDYILSHTGPTHCVQTILNKNRYSIYDMTVNKVTDPVSKYLEHIDEICEFNTWFFGHMHENWFSDDGKYICLYEDIMELRTDGQ